MSSWMQSLQMHEILIYGLIFGLPIVVIGFAFIEKIIKMLIRHRERLNMIDQGLDPDDYLEQPDVEDLPAQKRCNMDETQPYTPRGR